MSHSTLSAGLVAPCCWDCSHICSLSEQWRQCRNTPPHGTRECSLLVAFLEVPCNTASDHAWVRTEPHLVSAGKECDVFVQHVVTLNDLRVLLLRRTGKVGNGCWVLVGEPHEDEAYRGSHLKLDHLPPLVSISLSVEWEY